MTRLATLAAGLISLQVLLGGAPARAADERYQDEMRGMLVFKLPFGGAKSFSAPRFGFDFQMQRKSDLDYLKDRYDPETGRRLPEVDADGMRTWSLEPPEFKLPDKEEGEGKPEPHGPRKEPRPLS